jgi:extradiol dioxygenase family protein
MAIKAKIASRYDYDSIDAPVVMFEGEDGRSRTLQSGVADADINTIMDRYEKTGLIPLDGSDRGIPQFGDFSDIGDFHGVMSKLVRAQQNFMMLPPKVRSRFDNDVAKMLDFIADPANVEEAVKLGLADASALPVTVPVIRPTDEQVIAQHAADAAAAKVASNG